MLVACRILPAISVNCSSGIPHTSTSISSRSFDENSATHSSGNNIEILESFNDARDRAGISVRDDLQPPS